jgi:hypothetical protein
MVEHPDTQEEAQATPGQNQDQDVQGQPPHQAAATITQPAPPQTAAATPGPAQQQFVVQVMQTLALA